MATTKNQRGDLSTTGDEIILEAGSGFSTTLLASGAASDKTLTLPNATDTLVGKATTDTLTNKTLTTPLITGGDATADIDTATGTTLKIGTSAATTITIGRANQTINLDGDVVIAGNLDSNEVQDDTFTIVDSDNETKAINFDAGTGATASTTTTIKSSQSQNRTITLPDATTTLAGLGVAQTFTATQTFPSAGIVVGASTPFSDSAGTLTLQNIDALDATTEATIEAAIDTLANLTSIQSQSVSLSGTLTLGANFETTTGAVTLAGNAGGSSVTLPASGTLATLTGTETLDNKILISQAANPASAGALRLGNTETLSWRNAANSADITLSVDSSDEFNFNGTALTTTELGYLAGTTSAVQTQLDAKLDDFTSTTDNALVRTDGTSGTAVQDSGIIIDDSDNMSGVTSLTVDANSTIDVAGAGTLAIGGSMGANSLSLGSTTGNVDILGTDSLILPQGTDAQRNVSPVAGMIRYNTDSSAFEGYTTDWGALGGGGSGGINLIENSDGESTLDKGATNDVQDWIDEGSGTTSSVTTTTADIPLYPNKETGIQILVEASGSGFTRYRFTMPDALVNQGNMPLSWFQNTVGSYADDSITVSLKSYSDSAFSTGEVSHSFVDGWDGTVKAFEGKFTTAFAPDGSNLYYELQFARTGGAANEGIVLNDVRVGPDPILYAPVVTGWISYTPTFSASWGTTANVAFKYRRVGDSVQIKGTFDAGTTTAAEAQIGLPDDLTISIPGNQPLGAGDFISDRSSVNDWHLLATNGDTFLNIGNVTTSTGVQVTPKNATDIAVSGDTLSVTSDMIPISEWSGQAQHTVGQNDVEYASNSSTTDAADTSSFVYGPAGSEANYSFTAARKKRVQFTTNITATDELVLEVSEDQVKWTTLPFETVAGATFADSDLSSVGAHIVPVSGSSNQVDVEFQQYRNSTNAWNAASETVFWRVKKARSGIVTNYGLATADRAGLVKKNKWQEFILSSDETTTGSDQTQFTFNNLVVGNHYRIYVQAFGTWSTNASQLKIVHDGNILANSRPDYTADDTKFLEATFKATTTSATFVVNLGTGATLYGNTSTSETRAVIAELNNYEDETTDFT